MFNVSFTVFVIVSALDSRRNRARGERAADELAVIEQNQRLGRPAAGEVKEYLLLLGGLGQPSGAR